VLGKAAATSTITSAVCFLFLFSRTFLISHKSASVVFLPARGPCCPECHHPFSSPWVDKYSVIAFSASFAIVGRTGKRRETTVEERVYVIFFFLKKGVGKGYQENAEVASNSNREGIATTYYRRLKQIWMTSQAFG
jgi:hypothetical protein